MQHHVPVPPFELPRHLVEAVAAVEAAEGPQPARRAWIAALPAVVADLCDRWLLDVRRPFQPGGVSSWVAPARDRAGRHLVLKVGWAHDEARDEAAALQLWDGRGAVRLYESLDCGDTVALLLEACEPGTPLRDALPPHEQDEVVAGLLRRLWVEAPAGHAFRALQEMCHAWADEIEHKATGSAPVLDPGLLRAGTELFRTLPSSAARSVLLCTDLHAGNVLAATREPWLVIDPKPYVGDPTYDALQHVLNQEDRLAHDPGALVRRMSGLLDLDADRLTQWLFARCVVESLSPDLPIARQLALQLAP